MTAVFGEFERGSCLAVVDPGGGARSLAALRPTNAAEARSILGCPSDRIEACLGFRGPDELIHRDDLVIIGR